jgi:hypothetical protein
VRHDIAFGRLFQRKIPVRRKRSQEHSSHMEGIFAVDMTQVRGGFPYFCITRKRSVLLQETRFGEKRSPFTQGPGFLGREAKSAGGLIQGRTGTEAFQAADKGGSCAALAVFFQYIGENPVSFSGVKIQVS